MTGRLTGLGLRVQLQSEVRDDVVPDQVTDVDPAGRALVAGDTVVVRYAVAKAGDGAGRDGSVLTGAAAGVGSSSGEGSGDGTQVAVDEAAPTDAGGAAVTTQAGRPAATTTSQPTESSPAATETTETSTETSTTTTASEPSVPPEPAQ